MRYQDSVVNNLHMFLIEFLVGNFLGVATKYGNSPADIFYSSNYRSKLLPCH